MCFQRRDERLVGFGAGSSGVQAKLVCAEDIVTGCPVVLLWWAVCFANLEGSSDWGVLISVFAWKAWRAVAGQKGL